MEAPIICQARLLLREPKVFFEDGSQVFVTTICATKLDQKTCGDPALCNSCAAPPWGEPIHGLVSETPPPFSHCYGSEWFEERLKGGAKISLRNKLFLKAAEAAAVAGRVHPLRAAELHRVCAERSASRINELQRPKEVKPRVKVILKSMPARKAQAQPPPPPSSPTHGSLPAPPAVTPGAVKKKRTKATPSRKRSPTARIADRSDAPAVAIGDDFQRTQQKVEALKSSLHVFEPAVFECDDEPLEIEEYEYVKLHKVDGQDGLLQDEETHAKFSYSIEKGIVSV